jgi:rfaE bifunctional protein kinase chain/domain
MDNLKEAFHAFNDLRILVIGDAMIDSYFWGIVDRISPEAPVPVISRTKRESRLGGAANVALNIKALGAEPVLASVIGNDDRADLFKSLMDDKGLTKYGIFESNTRLTTIKTRIISKNQHLLRVDEEMDENLDPETENAFLNHLLYIISQQKIDAIVFEDYDKGSITPLIINEIVKAANEKNIPTLVDPKKRNYNYYKNVTLFKPNFKELVEGLNIQINKNDFESIFKAAQVMQSKQNIQWTLITLSELGVLISNKEEFKRIPAEIRDISDVSGAGDTIIGITSVCLALGMSPWVVAAIANIGGGLVCEKSGVVPIEKQKLLEESSKILEQVKLV